MPNWEEGAGGALSGAATGASIGALGGPIGVGAGTAIGAAIGGIAGLFGGSEQGPTESDIEYQNRQARAYNEYLDKYGEAGQQALELFSSAGLNPFGTQTSTSSQTGTSSFSESTTPTTQAADRPLEGLERTMLERRLSSPTGLPAGYVETGVSNINQSAEGAAARETDFARSRGIDPNLLKIGSPAERSRRQQIATLRTEAPLKARELQNQDMGLAETFLRSRLGQKRRGSSTSSSTGTSTAPPDYLAALQLIAPAGPRAVEYPT